MQISDVRKSSHGYDFVKNQPHLFILSLRFKGTSNFNGLIMHIYWEIQWDESSYEGVKSMISRSHESMKIATMCFALFIYFLFCISGQYKSQRWTLCFHLSKLVFIKYCYVHDPKLWTGKVVLTGNTHTDIKNSDFGFSLLYD